MLTLSGQDKLMEYKEPFFSIIIPTYGRPNQLSACVKSLTHMEYPRDRFQVIVVDDGGSFSLNPVLAPFQISLDLKLITQPHLGPAGARNTGAANANGDFLAFTDDDCSPDPNWLKNLAKRFERTPDHMIGGQTLNTLSSNAYSTASQQLISYLYDYYSENRSGSRLFISNNMAVPAGQFHGIGGFNISFARPAGEDRDFCDRWQYHGYEMTYAPEVVVYHFHALDLRGFWQQHLGYGRGAFHFHQLRARRRTEGMKMEPPSFYLNLLHYPFSQTHSWWQALPIAALLALSQIANAAGYFWERFKRFRQAECEKEW